MIDFRSAKPGFGSFLATLRERAGIQSQGELAGLLGKSQQTVSRWESGKYRPSVEEVVALAAILNGDVDEMMETAGYAVRRSSSGIVTFDKPLPVENLSPASFERLVADLVQASQPTARVNREGESGHKQDGIDVIARAGGQTMVFQCKRVESFGPADVLRAVRAYTGQADRRVIVLSRVASPKANAEVRSHPGWEIWDKEDLSRRFRELPHEAQDRLIDTYFPGRRFELVGRAEAGPWLEVDRFFEPFGARDAAFSHNWNLKGRGADMAAFIGALEDSSRAAVLLSAPGGFGKSRLLKEGLAAFQAANPAVLIRILSATSSPSPKDLEGLGSRDKIIVVDDAHDREDLAAVFDYCARPTNRARLVLASRPYGAERVKTQAAVFGISSVRTIEVTRLAKDELIALAGEVLTEFRASPAWADHVVAVAGGSPLVAVMAARVMAKEKLPPGLAATSEELRNLVLGKFSKVIVGDIGSPSDQEPLARLLPVLALIQPFDPQDPAFAALALAVLGFDDTVTTRLVRLLTDGGVIYKRGRNFRLMPDVLGDFLIEREALTFDRRLSPFVDRVFSAAGDLQIGRVILNLGRLDWRLNEGDPSNSTLLEGIWRKLDAIDSEWDRRLDAVDEVAAYQPRQALEFVERKLRAGKSFGQFPRILRRIAYSGTHFNEAIELLWELARNDTRETGPLPEHPARVLSDLTSVEQHKPFEISAAAFEFGMKLMSRPGVWRGPYTPLNVVTPMFSAEGTTTTSNLTSFTVSSFLVNYKLVAPYRARLVDRMIELLVGDNVVAAQLAAQTFEKALRGPMGLMNHSVPSELAATYEAEFLATLKKLHATVATKTIHPAALMNLAKAISWHAQHGGEETSTAAHAIMDRLPNDLNFRTWAALSDGFGQVFLGPWNPDTYESDIDRWVGSLVADLTAAFGNGEALRAEIDRVLKGLSEAGIDGNSTHVLIYKLLFNNTPLARVFIENAQRDPESATARFAGIALSQILSSEPTEGRRLVRTLLSSSIGHLRFAAAGAMSGLRRAVDDDDASLVLEIAANSDVHVVACVVRSIFGWSRSNPGFVLRLIHHVNMGGSQRIADDLSMLLRGAEDALLKSMSVSDVDALLGNFLVIPTLDGHWINEVLAYLSEHHALAVARFFFDRVDMYSVKGKFNESRPVNYGPWTQKKLRFSDSPDADEVLRSTWTWLKANADRDFYFQENAAHLFEAMFDPSSEAVLSLLKDRAERGAPDDLLLITKLLRNVYPGFVFRERDFVVSLLDRCKATDSGLLERAKDSLFCSAISGVRSGTVGQPTRADLTMKDRADEAMSAVSRLSPAFDVYKDLSEHAQWSINRSIADGMRDDDE